MSSKLALRLPRLTHVVANVLVPSTTSSAFCVLHMICHATFGSKRNFETPSELSALQMIQSLRKTSVLSMVLLARHSISGAVYDFTRTIPCGRAQ
ncbi:hypothetical protein C8R48DRAFT_734547 [Suillus tomentosus]|nr:hypothetical protein C8R48DRAFT_734547 [Suillus tomentosus]